MPPKPPDTSEDQMSSSLQSHVKYRPDIDGLRAVAVLSVVFFHAFPKVVKGGFVGVDIFFVISGYLISTIIFNGLDSSAFSFTEFYSRRVRRIFPALSIVLLGSFVFGWVYLLSGEFKQLGKHIAAGAGFVSNLVLWNESGYFDKASDTKPLLHLWSLGIEEQFYIVWPLLLWLAWKTRLNLLSVSVVIASISFFLNIQKVTGDVVADFYSPQTRFWELMLGTILAYTQLHYQSALSSFRLRISRWISAAIRTDRFPRDDVVIRDVESLSGMVLIFVGIFALHSDSKFPGWWALGPTLGAVLVISAGPQARINRTVLSSRIVVWFGLISFPLYLWHWPLLSFLRLTEGVKPSVVHQMLAISTSVVLAWLTFKLIEKPIRKGKYARSKTIVLVVFLTMVGLVGYNTYARDGIPSRGWVKPFDEVLSKLEQAKDVNSYNALLGSRSCFQLPQERSKAWFIDNACLTIEDPKKPTVFLIGDSHSASLSVGLRALAAQYRLNFLQMSSGWCPPFGNDEADLQCVSMNKFVAEQIKIAHPDVLIIDAHWLNESGPTYFKGDGDFISYLEARIAALKLLAVKKIIVVGQIPTWTADLPDILARRYVIRAKSIPERTFSDIEPASLRMDSRMKAMSYPADTTYLSLKDALCNETGCLTSIGPNLDTDILVWDYGHLSRNGAIFVTENVIKRPLMDALNIR
jgi:peptidoglycan/LPS O-acetylase OafA/YrhL